MRALPFDKVKIDRCFVQGIGGDATNHAIVQLIVGLARELDMDVIAEGVETEAEAIVLQAAGVTTFQGYYFGRPKPADEICALIAPSKRRAAVG